MTKNFLWHQQKAYLGEILQIEFAFGLFSKKSKEPADGLLHLLSFMEINGSMGFKFACSANRTSALRPFRGLSSDPVVFDCYPVDFSS